MSVDHKALSSSVLSVLRGGGGGGDGGGGAYEDDYYYGDDEEEQGDEDNSISAKLEEGNHQEQEEEHPMRTDEWLVKLKIRGASRLWYGPAVREEADLFPEGGDDLSFDLEKEEDGVLGFFRNVKKKKSKCKGRREQIMKFSRNGYVLVVENEETPLHNKEEEENGKNLEDDGGSKPQKKKQPTPCRRTAVGKWRLDPSGVSWDIPVRRFLPTGTDEDGEMTAQRTILHYHADIHLNKFGAKPRMFRGIVTRDRYRGPSSTSKVVKKKRKSGSSFLPPTLFRPVLATFTAIGVGKDTADISYKDRGFGLPRSPPQDQQ